MPKSRSTKVYPSQYVGPIKKRRLATVKVERDDVYGDMGLDDIKKPLNNLDIPSDAEFVEIQVIGGNETFTTAFPTSNSTQKAYGMTLMYKFPEYPENAIVTQPNTPIITNKIYDIDCELSLKELEAPMNYIFDKAGGTAEDKFKSTIFNLNALSSTGGNVNMKFGETSYQEFELQNFMIYVLPRSRQKILGQWLEDRGLDTGKLKIGTHGISGWMFDDFCYNVKPIFARYVFFERDTIVSNDYAQAVKEIGERGRETQQFEMLTIRNPFATNIVAGGHWASRDFHLYQSQVELAPCDSYASELLIGTLGQCSMSNFNFFRLQVYYNKTEVDAQSLFWQQQKQFSVPLTTRGSRHCYGTPEWYNSAKMSDCVQIKNGINFKGIVTSSVGDLDLFEGGRLTSTSDSGNIFLDTDVGGWY